MSGAPRVVVVGQSKLVVGAEDDGRFVYTFLNANLLKGDSNSVTGKNRQMSIKVAQK